MSGNERIEVAEPSNANGRR